MEYQMKILLAAINAKYIHSNPAVYSLRAYACKYKDEIGIAEYTINQTIDEILMDIYRRQPDILCISCYLWNISYVRQVITETPKILPDVRIWLGGPEVSFDGREILQAHPCLTGVMCGEGEETFLELMEYYHGQPEKGADQMEAEQGAGGVCPGESLTLGNKRHRLPGRKRGDPGEPSAPGPGSEQRAFCVRPH